MAVRVGIGSRVGPNADELLDLRFEDADPPFELQLIRCISLQLNRLLFDRPVQFLQGLSGELLQWPSLLCQDEWRLIIVRRKDSLVRYDRANIQLSLHFALFVPTFRLFPLHADRMSELGQLVEFFVTILHFDFGKGLDRLLRTLLV